jgi:prepilin-type N-terminal cleavage/methylation domain-containing protein
MVQRSRANPAAGFTLVELIAVIAVTGIVAATIGQLIGWQMAGYQQMGERAALVQMAQSAIRRIERDVRRGLPNSLRVNGDGSAVEIINVVDARRYRAAPRVVELAGGADISGQVNIEGAPIRLTLTNHSLDVGDMIHVPALNSDANPYWLVGSVVSADTVQLQRYNGNTSATEATGRTISSYTYTNGSPVQIVTSTSHEFTPGQRVIVRRADGTNPYAEDTYIVDDAGMTATQVQLLQSNSSSLNGDGVDPNLSGGSIQPFLGGGASRLLGLALPTQSLLDPDPPAPPTGVSAELCRLTRDGEAQTIQTFDLIGNFSGDPSGARLVVYNLTATAASTQNAYRHWSADSGNVAMVQTYTAGGSNDDQGSARLTLSNGHTLDDTCAFPQASQQQRIYWVDTPVTFVCADGRLTRRVGYTPAAASVSVDFSGGTGADLTDHVDGCVFSMTPGNGDLPPLLSITLRLRGNTGESISLTQQVSIENEI